MAISKRLRYEILKRDGYTCRYCGGYAPDVSLTIDHVRPVTLGGLDEPTNLVTACADCNAGKASVSPESQVVEDVAADALRWSSAMQHAAAEMAKAIQVTRDYEQSFIAKWSEYHYGRDACSVPYPPDWRTKIRSLYEVGFPLDVLLECVEIAMASQADPENTFRYFCGVTNNKVLALQERARELIEQENTDGA